MKSFRTFFCNSRQAFILSICQVWDFLSCPRQGTTGAWNFFILCILIMHFCVQKKAATTCIIFLKSFSKWPQFLTKNSYKHHICVVGLLSLKPNLQKYHLISAKMVFIPYQYSISLRSLLKSEDVLNRVNWPFYWNSLYIYKEVHASNEIGINKNGVWLN